MQQVKVAPFAPESNRDRFLHVKSMSISNSNWGDGTSNGPMSVQTARECFQSLKTPEAVTIYTIFPVSTPVSLPGKPAVSVDLRQTDDIFWHVFDFSFINGKPYDKAVFDAGQPVAVLTESVARSLFGTTDVAGRGIHVDGVSHVVNFTLPEQSDDYVHRIGRTGRAGTQGVSISFLSEDDAFYLSDIEKAIGQKLPLTRMDGYC